MKMDPSLYYSAKSLQVKDSQLKSYLQSHRLSFSNKRCKMSQLCARYSRTRGSPRVLDFLTCCSCMNLGELEVTRRKEGWGANSMASTLNLAKPQVITGPWSWYKGMGNSRAASTHQELCWVML